MTHSLSASQLARTMFAQTGACSGVAAQSLASIIISIQCEVRARS